MKCLFVVLHLEHYLVVFKEDDIKKIVSAEELRKCDDRVKGASCEALWKDSNHTDWYPAFIVDIGGEVKMFFP